MHGKFCLRYGATITNIVNNVLNNPVKLMCDHLIMSTSSTHDIGDLWKTEYYVVKLTN